MVLVVGLLAILVPALPLPRSATAGVNSWSPMTLPYAMNITTLAVSPAYPCDRTVFMGTDGHGVFRSTDISVDSTWLPVNTGLSDLGILALAISPNYGRCDRLTDQGDRTLFVATRSGVFRSRNGGASWEPRNDGLPANLVVQALAISPNYSSDGTVFAGFDGSLYRSTDRGESWLRFDAGLSDRTIQAFAPSANFANDNTLFLGTRFSGVYRITATLQTPSAPPPPPAAPPSEGGGNLPLPRRSGAVTVQQAIVVEPPTPDATAIRPATVGDTGGDRRIMQTGPSLGFTLLAGHTPDGQIYHTVPGPVPLQMFLTNTGDTNLTNIVAILDVAGNDNPGCTDNPETDADETTDDVVVAQVPFLVPGQSVELTTTMIIRPANETAARGTDVTFPLTRVQACTVASGGVFASDDALVQLVVWQSITPSGSALSNLWVTSFAVSPFYANDQTIFAGTAYGGLYRSTNAATARPTWELVNQGLDPTFTWVRAITLSPRYPFDRTIWVGTENGVFRGIEAAPGGPISWVPMSRGLVAPDVRALGISPDYGRDRVLFAGVYGADVYRITATADDVPWQPYRRTLSGLWSWSLALTQEGVLLNGTWGRSVGRMVLPTGSDWSYAQPGLPGDAEVTALEVSPGYCSGATVFAGTWAHGLFRSRDAGASWTATNYSVTQGPIRDVAIAPSYERGHTLAVAVWGGGVLLSHDDGVSWSPLNAGLPDLRVRSLAFSPGYPADQTLYAGTDGAGLFRYDAGQGRWVPVGAGLPGNAVMAVALSPQFLSDGTVLAGTWGGGVFISHDRGANWSPAVSQPNLFVRALAFSPDYTRDGTVYAGTNRGLYQSSDRGRYWQLVGAASEQITGVDITDVAVTMTVPRTVFVSTGGRGVWQYTDTAATRYQAQAAYQTSQLIYRAFVPAVAKGRPRNGC
ncbi:MAG: hypothetical protein HY689_02845 [Chloroflexi bacterium]|nr:hypothetical protein [Chloroflexota bacterium]